MCMYPAHFFGHTDCVTVSIELVGNNFNNGMVKQVTYFTKLKARSIDCHGYCCRRCPNVNRNNGAVWKLCKKCNGV